MKMIAMPLRFKFSYVLLLVSFFSLWESCRGAEFYFEDRYIRFPLAGKTKVECWGGKYDRYFLFGYRYQFEDLNVTIQLRNPGESKETLKKKVENVRSQFTTENSTPIKARYGPRPVDSITEVAHLDADGYSAYYFTYAFTSAQCGGGTKNCLETTGYCVKGRKSFRFHFRTLNQIDHGPKVQAFLSEINVK